MLNRTEKPPIINIAYPFHLNNKGRTALSANDDHVREMLEQLLFTSPGERVNRPDFGSGIQQLVFAPTSPELATALQFALKAAIQRWLGDVIQLQGLEVTSEESTLSIVIQYIVQRTGEQQVAQFSQTV
jgi:uncharacterized protein